MRKIFSILTILVLVFAAATGCTKVGADNTITFETDTYSLPKGGGVYEITYTSETSHTITAISSEDWITDINTSEPGKIVLTYETNNTGEVRESIVELEYDGGRNYLTIMQQSVDENPDYVMELVSYNDYDVHFKITPGTEGKLFFYGVEKKEIYRQLSSEQFFIDHQIDKIRKEAEEKGTSFETLYNERCASTAIETKRGDLESNTDYILYCAEVDAEMKIVSELFTSEFTSKDPITFELLLDINGPVVTITSIPAYNDRTYYYDAFSAIEYGDASNLKDALATTIREEIEYYGWSLGLSVEEYINNICTTGESVKTKELNIEERYYAFAICLNTEAEFTSEMEIVEFTTEEVVPSDNVIEIEISKVESTSAHYKVTTSNDDTYLFFIDFAENWEGYSDEDLMAHVGGMFPTTSYGRHGDVEGDTQSLQADTDYIAFAFGCVAGTPTTGLTKVEFSTEPMAMSDNVITIEVTDITSNSFHIATETTNEDPYVLFADYAEGWNGYSDDELIDYVIESYSLEYYTYYGNMANDVSDVESNSEFVAFAFGFEGGFPTTDLVRHTFRTLE